MKNLPIIFSSLIVISIMFMGCGNEGSEQVAEAPAAVDEAPVKGGQSSVVDDVSGKNIVQIAVGSPDHTILVAAVQAAEFVDVLVNAGPLTVFAPTNAAFDALPESTVENLLKPENKATLARIVKLHAAPGNYKVEALKDGMKLYQATGHYVDVEVKDDGTYVHGAKILGSIEAVNGIVHVVDKVFLPPETT